MSTQIPFLKPKTTPIIPRHTCSLINVTDKLPKSPIRITMPWIDKMQKSANFVRDLIREYQNVFPTAAHPSNNDLLEWLYNRAVDAENNYRLLKQENQDHNITDSGKKGV